MDLRTDRLTVVARLKAAQISQVLSSLLGEIILISSRSFLQSMLSSYYNFGVDNIDNSSIQEFNLVLESTDNCVAGAVYSDDFTKISYNTVNGSVPTNSTLPIELFPLESPIDLNITYINGIDGYMRGPVPVNESFFLSFTRAIMKNNPDFENSNRNFTQNVIGYLTIVSQASSLVEIMQNLNIEKGTRMAIIGLSGNYSRSQAKLQPSLNYTFVLPSDICPTCNGSYSLKPNGRQYSALVNGTYGTARNINMNGIGKVAIAYAPVRQISQVWAVLIFQAHSVLYKPIMTLRVILLVCVLAIGFGVCLTTFLLSGWVVKPITRLQAATEQSTNGSTGKRKNGRFKKFFTFWRSPPKEVDESKSNTNSSRPFSSPGSEFRIPEQVVTRKYIKDELTELTETFNEMTAELRKQYTILEERVVQRTNEIKAAKVHAETANEAKSLFIANITHELRTPLNGILGMAAVSMEESDPQSIRNALKVIFKSGELLLRLLTDLLSFSKSQVDNMQLEPKGFAISEVISQLHAIFDEQSKIANIGFSIEVLSPFLYDMEFRGDINRILQVLMNLVSNSLKFTTEGTVTVTFSASIPGSEKTEESSSSPSTTSKSLTPILESLSSVDLSIKVTDTGPGIAPHLQSKVFEPFVQGDLALSEKRGGVGLGLSICSQLAHLMNGEISLTSELGKGSVFTFNLPLEIIQYQTDVKPSEKVKQWDMPHSSVTSPSDEDLQKRMNFSTHSTSTISIDADRAKDNHLFADLSVLIAEDNKVNQEVLVKMLKLEGLSNVRVAKDGLEAVNAVKECSVRPFDVIFMDIQMPHLDGKQATEIIRKELNFTGVIIAVSAFTDSSNIEDCLAVGMEHFLAKPLRRPQLHSLLLSLQNRP